MTHLCARMCASGWICQIINQHLDKDHMCASLCASPTTRPRTPLHAGPQPYQQECWGIVWSAAVTSWQPVKGNSTGVTPSFLLVASATRCPTEDRPLRPFPLYESSNVRRGRETPENVEHWVPKSFVKAENLFDGNVNLRTWFLPFSFSKKPALGSWWPHTKWNCHRQFCSSIN